MKGSEGGRADEKTSCRVTPLPISRGFKCAQAHGLLLMKTTNLQYRKRDMWLRRVVQPLLYTLCVPVLLVSYTGIWSCLIRDEENRGTYYFRNKTAGTVAAPLQRRRILRVYRHHSRVQRGAAASRLSRFAPVADP